jgi:sodium/hydrogen antiporter
MPAAITPWFLVAGCILVLMALAGSVLKRLPLSTSTIYLVVGVLIGPYGWGLLRLDPLENARLLEVLTEIVVLISLFTAGLKLSPPLTDRRWWIPLRLAFGAMTLTVGMLTLIGVYLLDLPVGAAVLLGAILAPTDPVLASDVQVTDHEDHDRLRFGLSGEAGMNDGTAFPFVMLGLGLLGLHEIGPSGGRWWTVDVLWAVPAGIGSGFACGWLIAQLVLYLRRRHREAIGLDEFLTLGLIALSYGIALLIHSYGFLAVFAAGLALRRIEQREAENHPTSEPSAPVRREAKAEPQSVTAQEAADEEMIATDPKKAPTYLAKSLLSFNEQLERIGEVTLVLLLGGMLSLALLPPAALWFVPLLFLVVRPVAVGLSLIGSRTSAYQRSLISWFGIRGIGSIYYLMYAINHGLSESHVRMLTGLTFAAIAASIVVHGISVTPLMNRYEKRIEQEKRSPQTADVSENG